jgi:hypothetical protein
VGSKVPVTRRSGVVYISAAASSANSAGKVFEHSKMVHIQLVDGQPRAICVRTSVTISTSAS